MDESVEYEFTDTYEGLPAKICSTTAEATELARRLFVLELPYIIKLRTHKLRFGLPMDTIIMLLEVDRGVIH